MPIYVGNSINFANAGLGGIVEEELETFKQVVAVALDKLQHLIKLENPVVNGVNG
jgi:hypothetical protein